MKVLFLTPWYPSKKDEMSGLFVYKHAGAVRSQGIEVRVIFSQGWHDTWRQWRALRREGWMPDVVQLNVIQKQGLLALWLKRHYGIPYIIVEHWSGYLPENGQYAKLPVLKRRFMQRVCRQAEGVWTVSAALQKAMRERGLRAKRWGQIDNVVDDFFWKSLPQPLPKGMGLKTLLHVSCFDERAKNIKGLLNAVKMLADKRQDFELVLVGTGVDFPAIRAYAEALGLMKNGIVRFVGEQTPEQVSKWMHRADALVLSSRYETYGIVLAEAASAGLPILSTPVGIAEELGALIVSHEIAQNKPGTFAEFIEAILFSELPNKFDKSESSARFSAESIGKRLKENYEQALNCN